MDHTVNRARQAGHRHDSDHLENTCGEPGMRNRCVILFDRASPSNRRDRTQPLFCYKLPRAVKTTLTKAAAGSTGAGFYTTTTGVI